jgi:hypothetical protein
MSLTLESLRQRIIDAELLSGDELDEAHKVLADPEFWDLGPCWIAAWGRRPA